LDNEALKRKALLLALTAGRRFLLLCLGLGVLLLLAGGFWFITQIHIVASLTAISVLLAYVLAPAVHYLHHKRKLNRILAITLVYLGVLVLVIVGMAYVIPVVHEQFVALWSNLKGYLSDLQANVDHAFRWILARSPEFARPWLEKIDPESMRLETWANEIQNVLPSIAGSTFSGVFSGVKIVGGLLAGMVLVPLFTFYILMDAERYSAGFLRLVPARWKKDVAELMNEIDHVLGRYIRGQLLVCLTVGISIGVVLNLVGLKYATLIGVFAGIVDIIPYVGVAIGIVPAFIIALVHGGLLWAIFIVILMETVHWLEGHIIVPAVIGHSVGLPPLVVMVALGAGAELGGIMGMVLAIPAAAILRVLGNFYVRRLEAADADLAAAMENTLQQEIPLDSSNAGPPDSEAVLSAGASESEIGREGDKHESVVGTVSGGDSPQSGSAGSNN